MPELPEVETIRSDLDKIAKGKEISVVKILDQKAVKNISMQKFAKETSGKKFVSFLRRGKNLLLVLDSGKSILTHLMMTGSLRIAKKDNPLRFERVVFELTNKQKVSFCDIRRFGKIELIDSDNINEVQQFKKLGPEPLDKKFSFSEFEKILTKKTQIKSLLMDQAKIVGLGNIYASEALFLAGIQPTKLATKLTKKEKEKLYKAIKDVLKKGIKHRGSTIDDYVDAYGKKGRMQNHHQVYGKEKKPCAICGTQIKKIKVGGRSSCYCPKCQKS